MQHRFVLVIGSGSDYKLKNSNNQIPTHSRQHQHETRSKGSAMAQQQVGMDAGHIGTPTQEKAKHPYQSHQPILILHIQLTRRQEPDHQQRHQQTTSQQASLPSSVLLQPSIGPSQDGAAGYCQPTKADRNITFKLLKVPLSQHQRQPQQEQIQTPHHQHGCQQGSTIVKTGDKASNIIDVASTVRLNQSVLLDRVQDKVHQNSDNQSKQCCKNNNKVIWSMQSIKERSCNEEAQDISNIAPTHPEPHCTALLPCMVMLVEDCCSQHPAQACAPSEYHHQHQNHHSCPFSGVDEETGQSQGCTTYPNIQCIVKSIVLERGKQVEEVGCCASQI